MGIQTDLINFSTQLKANFKDNCSSLDSYLQAALEFDDFEKIYDIIQSIKQVNPLAYAKLYPYFYYHYC